MTKRSKVTMAAVLLVVTIAVGSAFNLRDGFVDQLGMLWLGGDTTVYSEGFSERGFDEIRAGQTKAEVISILGQPLYESSFESGGAVTVVMDYTDSSSDSHFRRRQIFLISDRVIKVSRSVHID